MHVYRRARVPLVSLPPSLGQAEDPDRAQIEPWRECDITVEGNRITAVVASAGVISRPSVRPENETDLGGAMVWPGLLDAHTHLDKAHTWHRAPNPTGEFWDALRILAADATGWTAEDLHRRADFALRSAWAHGTVAVRTHLDTGRGLGAVSHEVMAKLRVAWAERITLQTVSLCSLASFTGAEASRIVEITGRFRATALGGFPQPSPDLPKQLDALMGAARELGIGLDLHVDESGLVQAECLRATAEAVLRNQFPHPVACGHNCSLALQDPARAASTIDLVKAAGIHVIALPLCNLYLQGRSRGRAGQTGPGAPPSTPRWRGVTLLHEFFEAGVTLACASDNVRDAFYAWGDLDAMEVYQESVRIGHLDTRLLASPSVVTTGPARIMGLAASGRGSVSSGAPADLIVFPARTFNELLARPAAARRLIRGEGFRERIVPDYAELG